MYMWFFGGGLFVFWRCRRENENYHGDVELSDICSLFSGDLHEEKIRRGWKSSSSHFCIQYSVNCPVVKLILRAVFQQAWLLDSQIVQPNTALLLAPDLYSLHSGEEPGAEEMMSVIPKPGPVLTSCMI